jgi:glucan-binding YG repeat protein
MLTQWQSDNNKWYYLGTNGDMKTGWIYDIKSNKWYYANDNGEMQTGWQKIDDKWYYFDSSGAMKTGWMNDNGKDYCLYSNGEMIHDIDLYGWHFDNNGVATKIQ